MSGYDWQQAGHRAGQRSDERDRNAAVRGETVAAAPQRLASALDRIADALVALTLEREQAAAPPQGIEAPARVADHATLARVEERLDSAIAMLRGVLDAPAASPAPEPALEPASEPVPAAPEAHPRPGDQFPGDGD